MQQVKIEPFKIIGISIRTTNQNGKAVKDIGEMWGRFMSDNIVVKIPNKIGSTVFSLYTDYESDHKHPYTAVLGCKVEHLNDIPDGIIGVSIEGGTYIKSTARGDLTKGLIVNHWSKIFEMELNRTFIADFEVFGEKSQNPLDAEIDFYVTIND